MKLNERWTTETVRVGTLRFIGVSAGAALSLINLMWILTRIPNQEYGFVMTIAGYAGLFPLLDLGLGTWLMMQLRARTSRTTEVQSSTLNSQELVNVSFRASTWVPFIWAAGSLAVFSLTTPSWLPASAISESRQSLLLLVVITALSVPFGLSHRLLQVEHKNTLLSLVPVATAGASFAIQVTIIQTGLNWTLLAVAPMAGQLLVALFLWSQQSSATLTRLTDKHAFSLDAVLKAAVTGLTASLPAAAQGICFIIPRFFLTSIGQPEVTTLFVVLLQVFSPALSTTNSLTGFYLIRAVESNRVELKLRQDVRHALYLGSAMAIAICLVIPRLLPFLNQAPPSLTEQSAFAFLVVLLAICQPLLAAVIAHGRARDIFAVGLLLVAVEVVILKALDQDTNLQLIVGVLICAFSAQFVYSVAVLRRKGK